MWNAGDLSRKGLALSHTRVVFLPPNTTSKIQPLDAGIIANFKALFRKELIRFTFNQIESGVDTKEMADVTKTTILVIAGKKLVFF